MKRMYFAMSVLCCVLFFSCTGPNGNAYLKYGWSGSLTSIADTNPSIPYTFQSNVYYPTNPGTYYMEYRINGGTLWYLNYEITTKEGTLLNIPGDDTWFELYLTSSGVYFDEWNYARTLTQDEPGAQRIVPADSTTKDQDSLASGKKLGEILGTDERDYSFGSVKIEWGKVLSE